MSYLIPERVLEAASQPAVAAEIESTRASIDRLLWNRTLRSKGASIATQVRLANARANAVIDGIDFPLAAWSSGSAFEDSPLGRAAAGVWRLESELADAVELWERTPTGCLARLHSLLASGIVPDSLLGRPRPADLAPDDPLRLGAAPAGTDLAAAVRTALTGLTRGTALTGGAGGAALTADRNTPAVPALALAAGIHGELLSLRPFSWGSGPLARAAARLTLASRGADPDLLVALDAGIAALGRPAYVKAIRAYMSADHTSGDPVGIADWIVFCCRATRHGVSITENLI